MTREPPAARFLGGCGGGAAPPIEASPSTAEASPIGGACDSMLTRVMPTQIPTATPTSSGVMRGWLATPVSAEMQLWFVLSSETLSYYESPEAQEPLGMLGVDEMRSISGAIAHACHCPANAPIDVSCIHYSVHCSCPTSCSEQTV